MLCSVPFLRNTTIGSLPFAYFFARLLARIIRICCDLPFMMTGCKAVVSPSAASIGVRISCCSALSFRLLRFSLNATSTRSFSTLVCTLSIVTAPDATDCATAVLHATNPTRHVRKIRVNELVFITSGLIYCLLKIKS